MMLRTTGLALSVAMMLSACTSMPPEDPFVGWNKDYRSCRAEYQDIDARVATAGVGDASYYRVPGYPYLRTDRTLASFANEVKTIDEIGGWLRRMREADQEAREFEYINLGMSMQDAANQRARFLNCGRVLAGTEFFDQPAAFAHLLTVVPPKDEYSTTQRVLGLHALAAPGMRERLESRAQALKAAYALPDAPATASAQRVMWRAAADADLSLLPIDFSRVLPDELGFPGLTDSQWRALAEFNAPQLWIETTSDSDRLAMPVLGVEGPSADPGQPNVQFHVTFARFDSRPLIQLQYLFWFKGQSPQVPLDGFVWRVTLDDKGAPLIYESMHLSGRDHRWYPVQALRPRERNGDAKGIPVIAPRPAPSRNAIVYVRAGSHDIARVVDTLQEVDASEPQRYTIRRYEDLFTLPLPGGGTRSLFGPDGLVGGPYAPDPVGGYASGIPRAGALRQLGHHAITPVGRAHFDEHYLLESVFLPPGS